MEVTSTDMFQMLLLCLVVAAGAMVIEQVARILRSIMTFGIIVIVVYLVIAALIGA